MMTTTNNALLAFILQAIADRGPEPPGYSRPEVPGYPREQIDAAVDTLRRRGYVEAAYIPGRLGEDNLAHWEPSVITDQGHQWLESLKGEADG